MTTRAQRIERILNQTFAPTHLAIEDESARHAGHVERNKLPAGGETHFQLTCVSESFAGMSRVARSRAVHAALDAEFKNGLHALSLTLRTPAEAQM